MNNIPQIKDKVKALYLYLQSHESDHEGDSWYYWHNPNIVSHLNGFSKEDCEKLTLKIWDWDDDMLLGLADPFLLISNSNLDGDFLYCRIFLVIKDLEDLDYLSQNLQPALYHIKTRSQPLSFYADLENKINETCKHNAPSIIGCIKEKLEIEKSNN